MQGGGYLGYLIFKGAGTSSFYFLGEGHLNEQVPPSVLNPDLYYYDMLYPNLSKYF